MMTILKFQSISVHFELVVILNLSNTSINYSLIKNKGILSVSWSFEANKIFLFLLILNPSLVKCPINGSGSMWYSMTISPMLSNVEWPMFLITSYSHPSQSTFKNTFFNLYCKMRTS